MCGIAGMWGDVDAAQIQTMMRTMAHRGPDAEGLHIDAQDRGVLGHRRLSIMDPSGGNQPISNEDHSKTIIANGEIYNYPALRSSLLENHTFTTRSDSEAILHLYEDHGVQVANKLDGMFAFAISDGDHFYAARDPLGIKPLYYGKKNGSIFFASELKAIAGIANEVQEFPPGSWYHSQHGLHQFYEIPNRRPTHKPSAEWMPLIRRTLEEAIEKRLMSDVPVGAFLSGGLDSSLITALARQRLDVLHTFSVGVAGSRDLEAARLVARHLDTIHHEYIFTSQEVADLLPEVIYHLESFDQDLVRSAIPCYLVSRLASDYVKVILTGEGADELFAGYTYYKEIANPNYLHDELRRSVGALHNVNLQRVDRMTMAHSIEGRVPFLDVSMIDIALSIPPELKLLSNGNGERVEKWILRQACEDLLPREIVWREKEQFDQGSGTVEMLEDIAQDSSTQHPEQSMFDAEVRTREEKLYYEIFSSVFSSADVIQKNMGRWAIRPEIERPEEERKLRPVK